MKLGISSWVDPDGGTGCLDPAEKSQVAIGFLKKSDKDPPRELDPFGLSEFRVQLLLQGSPYYYIIISLKYFIFLHI